MDDHKLEDLTIGDLVTSGALLWEEDESRRVELIRDGDSIRVVTHWKNVGALLDANAAEANEFSRTGRLNEMVKVASIPTGLYYDWKSQGFTDDTGKMARLLNDADNAKLRVNSLRI